MLLLFCVGDSGLDRHDLFGTPVALLHLAQNFFLGAYRLCCCELPPGLVFLSGHKLELAGGNARLEVGANFGIGHFAHSASHGVAEEVAFIGDGFALEAALAGKGDRFAGDFLRGFGSAFGGVHTRALLGLSHDYDRAGYRTRRQGADGRQAPRRASA